MALPPVDKSFDYVSMPRELKSYISDKYYEENKTYKRNQYSYKPKWKRENYNKWEDTSDENFSFAPPSAPVLIMKATLEELRSTGFSSKVASNILKFIQSGGIIADTNRLMKIYGMDSTQLIRALPYLIFEKPIRSDSNNYAARTSFYKKQNSIIEINSANQSELESLDGIGSTLAERIIKFRESLGGFSSTDQLKDCYGITSELFEKIKPQLISNGITQTIYINDVDLSTFSHPYISRKIVKIMKAYKEHHGPFTDETELRKVYPSDTGWCSKILPYISFEIPGGD